MDIFSKFFSKNEDAKSSAKYEASVSSSANLAREMNLKEANKPRDFEIPEATLSAMREKIRNEVYQEITGQIDHGFASYFKKYADTTWNLLLRNSRDGGANSVLAAKLLAKIVIILKEVNESNIQMINSSNDLAQLIVNLEDISTQIKLLTNQSRMVSFNASIEAARAGEHGKTFAVVAEEINKLSSSTRELSLTTNESLILMEEKIKLNRETCTEVTNSCKTIEDELVQFNNLMSKIEQLSVSQTIAFELFQEKMDKKL